MIFLYPYRLGSNSCKGLSEALDGLIIRREGSRFRGSPRKKVINWGSSDYPDEISNCKVFNTKEAVKRASNKLEFFNYVSEVDPEISLPNYTSDPGLVSIWLEQNYTVVARKSLTGHSGLGIEIIEKGLDIPEAPFYTIYIPKDGEYRVHIVNGEIIDVQRKIRDPEREVSDWKVRSHQNGFMFIRNTEEGISYKDKLTNDNSDILVQAMKAFRASGLDFGAVDVIFNKKRNKAYVLEINCAPGLEGQTVDKYAEAFRKII